LLGGRKKRDCHRDTEGIETKSKKKKPAWIASGTGWAQSWTTKLTPEKRRRAAALQKKAKKGTIYRAPTGADCCG
jgi:hypothetical protein